MGMGDDANRAVRARVDVRVGCATEDALDGVGDGRRVRKFESYGSSFVDSTVCGLGTDALAP